VRIASDQVESVRRLGELAPRTVLRPQDMHLLGSCASSATGATKGVDPLIVEQFRPLARILLIHARRQLAAEARARLMTEETAA